MWAKGIFLGYVHDSYEYAVWDAEEKTIELARSIKRVPKDERHSADIVEQIDRRPQDMLHRAAWSSMPRQERTERMRLVDRSEEQPVARRKKKENLKVTMKDLKDYGFTPHCKRCEYVQA